MTRSLRLRPLLIAMAFAAAAPAFPVAAQETLLRLSETAEIELAPDQINATLRIDGTGETAAAAQEFVNRRSRVAVERIRAASGIEFETGGYWTSRDNDRGRWRAAQILELRAADGPAMLQLVGSLQGDGLALQRLGWTLSREASRKARQEATTQALTGLRSRAEAIAATLGLAFVSFREVRVDAPRREYPVAMRAAPMAAAASPTPPVAEPGTETVAATVEADAVLRPR